MTVPSDVPLRNPATISSGPSDGVQEPVAEPPLPTDSVQLALKVRTLDQKTYPITVCAAASVPQLKELVAMETGITLDRQRLIYRGRVLKNDRMLASYALEDGHVLHLVVRALPSPSSTDTTVTDHEQRGLSAGSSAELNRQAATTAAAAPNAQLSPSAVHLAALNEIDALRARLDEFDRSALQTRSRSRLRQRRARSPPPPPRDNDEPDPTMGRSGQAALPGRVLMGATITVPEGTNVTMPFLSSMIADLATQASETTGGEGEAGGTTLGVSREGQRHVTLSSDVPGGAIAAEVDVATARALRHHHRNREILGYQRAARRSSSGAERQAVLRARTGLRLESVRATLDDTSLDFPAELTALPQGDNNTAMLELQQQVEMLLALLDRFGPRLRLLPAALARRDHVSERAATAAALTESNIVSADPSPLTSALTGPSPPSSELTTASTVALIRSGPTPVGGDSPASVEHNTASANASVVAEPDIEVAGSSTAAVDSATPSTDSNTASAESASSSTPTTNSAATARAILSARHVICIIDALQAIGESTDLLARMARHAFVRRSVQSGEPIARRRDAEAAGFSADDRIRARFHAIQAGPSVANAARTSSAAGDRMHEALGAMQAATRTARQETQGAPNMRPRIRVARISATDLRGDRNSAAPTTVTTSSTGHPGITPSFPINLASGAVAVTSEPEPSALSNSQPPTGVEAAPSDGNGPLPSAGAPISIPGVSLPLMSSVVFPFSLAAGLGGSHATTTWNLADFVSRLTSELPISTLYGVIAGDATHLHHILAHVGFALFSGVDVPRVTRPNIRTWAQDLTGELRRLLQVHELPADVVDQVYGTVERRSALGSELLRAVDPFMVDLVDLLVRATSASRAAAFGTSSATFLQRMAQQVLCQLRCYARGDSSESDEESDERLKRVLQGLLVWLGMIEHLARFVVDSLLCWTEGDNRRVRRRQREEVIGDVEVANSPVAKRQRE
uniref:Ubiquitin-like domain-containing protein n=1 Tax=Hyaloperonospora arabidopsidis (strain Emoy2) TaxID=559515 RepID=M4B1B9_HYAAE